jgi:hypothetical protein
MLAVLVYLVQSVRRLVRTLGRGASVVAASFHEAQRMRRALPRTYMEE